MDNLKNKTDKAVNKPIKPKIIIEGITKAGVVFRPSDWAERICGSLSTFKNQRIYYSPLLKPSYKDKHRCIIVDPKLKETNPALYTHILEFAYRNQLCITYNTGEK